MTTTEIVLFVWLAGVTCGCIWYFYECELLKTRVAYLEKVADYMFAVNRKEQSND